MGISSYSLGSGVLEIEFSELLTPEENPNKYKL